MLIGKEKKKRKKKVKQETLNQKMKREAGFFNYRNGKAKLKKKGKD